MPNVDLTDKHIQTLTKMVGTRIAFLDHNIEDFVADSTVSDEANEERINSLLAKHEEAKEILALLNGAQ